MKLSGVPTQLRVGFALARRALWVQEQRARDVLWRRRLGYVRRPESTGFVALAEPGPSIVEATRRAFARVAVGVIAEGAVPTAFEQAADFYGIPVVRVAPAAAGEMVDSAIAERWPLIAIAVDAMRNPGTAWPLALREFVADGATLLLTGVTPSASDVVTAIGAALGIALPQAVAADSELSRVRFSGDRPDLAMEFRGVEIDSEPGPTLLEPPGSTVVAWRTGQAAPRAAVVEIRLGAGRVIASAAGSEVDELAAAFRPGPALRVLPAMMALRAEYGEYALQPPARFANFTIDDPALRGGRLGLDYARAVAAAARHGFHLTIATIPSELGLAEARIIDLLRNSSRHLSACFHGNNHSGYEFFLSESGRARYRSRSLASQRRSLAKAAARGSEFARRTGVHLDRVMVFPNGIGHVGIFTPLLEAGFIATANYSDRYPLGAPPVETFDIGMRPADLAAEWAGYPLLWRRGLADRTWLFDLFAGRPLLTFAHARAVDADLTAVASRADDVRRVEIQPVEWRGLETIARHSYLWQRVASRTWAVRMYSNEICLHNPDPFPRTYVVERPQLPPQAFLDAPGAASSERDRVEVEVGGRQNVIVEVRTPASAALPHELSCSLVRPRWDSTRGGWDAGKIAAGLARGTA